MDNNSDEVKVATFHNHYGALSFRRRVGECKLSPVPRALSSSCGTAAYFTKEFKEEYADDNLEAVYKKVGDKYEKIWGEC